MAIDDKGLKLVDGFYYPEDDIHCGKVMMTEVEKLYKLPAHPKGLAVQAGGNVGVFPVFMARMYKHVLTFEPDPENFRCLEINGGGCENLQMAPAALGAERGKCKVYQPDDEPNNCGALKVLPSEDGTIPIVALDEFNLPVCHLLYLDVEGFEADALRGAKETIMRCRPLIVIENKGHNPEFPPEGDPFDGSDALRRWVEDTFNYQHVSRLMRDDVFTPCSK